MGIESGEPVVKRGPGRPPGKDYPVHLVVRITEREREAILGFSKLAGKPGSVSAGLRYLIELELAKEEGQDDSV